MEERHPDAHMHIDPLILPVNPWNVLWIWRKIMKSCSKVSPKENIFRYIYR